MKKYTSICFLGIFVCLLASLPNFYVNSTNLNFHLPKIDKLFAA